MEDSPYTIGARWILPVDRPPLANGTITISGGTIAAVEPWRTRAVDEDLGNCAIVPGFVNCHTHLDLGGLRGMEKPGPDFTGWLREVVRYRLSRSAEQVQEDIRAGIAESLACGTTLVGDISAASQSWSALDAAPLRALVFHEVLGLPLARARGSWKSACEWLDSRQANSGCRQGLSPHAPYSVRASLFRLALRTARRRGLPVAIHVAESPAELELIDKRSGPFVDFLTDLGVWEPNGLIGSIEDLLRLARQAGNVLLVHANYLDPARLSSADTIVYCPRTHAAFGHPAYPLELFLKRGVRVALGTDSLASNPDLSLLEEARFIYRHYREIAPAEVLRLATLNGAEALGFSEKTGTLTPGKAADLVAIALPPEQGDPCEQLLAGVAQVQRVVVGGKGAVAVKSA